jgi:hypothetical protein
MPSILPGNGVICTYNGFTFDPAWTETLTCDISPKLDRAGRTVSHNQYAIRLRTVITSSHPTTTDALVQDAIQRLTTPGQDFFFQDRGFGTLSVNVAGTRRKDVKWGPKPKLVSLKHIGDKYAQELIWQVEVATVDCNAARYQNTPIEFNYEVIYSHDENRNTTRKVNGTLTIAQTRQAGGRQVFTSADEWREKITPALIEGFRRGPESWNLSEDRATIKFDVTDTQMGRFYPPPGVISVKASRSWDNKENMNFIAWHGRINAEYTLARDADNRIAFQHFRSMCETYLKTAEDQLIAADMVDVEGKQKEKNKVIKDIARVAGFIWNPGLAILAGIQKDFGKKPAQLPISFSASEPEIYGPNVIARFSLTVLQVGFLPVFLTAGLWSPVPQSNWKLWAQSMAFGPRASGGLAFNPLDDAIIDACRGEPSSLKFQSSKPIPITILGGSNPVGTISPESSWMDYENSIRYEQGGDVVFHNPLSEEKFAQNPVLRGMAGPLNIGGGRFGKVSEEVSLSSYGNALKAKSTIYRRTAPTRRVVMTGRAVRAGWPAYPPELVSVGGIPATCIGGPIETKVVGHVGVPIYACRWRLTYILPETPRSIEAPSDPNFGMSNNGLLGGS